MTRKSTVLTGSVEKDPGVSDDRRDTVRSLCHCSPMELHDERLIWLDRRSEQARVRGSFGVGECVCNV